MRLTGDADAILSQLFANASRQEHLQKDLEDEWQQKCHAMPSTKNREADCEADEGEYCDNEALSSEEIIRRIETTCLYIVTQSAQNQLPDIFVDSKGNINVGAYQECSYDPHVDTFSQPSSQPTKLKRLRSLHMKGQPESAEQYARIIMVMEVCHELLLSGMQITQRELYYRLKTEEIFRSLRDVNEAVQDTVSLLNVPRSQLAITCSSKGLVAGNLVIHDCRTGGELDCSNTPNKGQQIPGDISVIRNYAFQSDALVILVIEKDAIFQRLATDGFLDMLPAILVTGKGMPDLATRVFLAALAEAFPDKPVLGIVDWNPSGVAILSQYKWGSYRMECNSRHAVPGLQWLGTTTTMLEEAGAESFQALTSRDESMARNMQMALAQVEPGWAEELQAMMLSRSKAEIEAVYTVCGADGFNQLLVHHMIQGGYIPDPVPCQSEGGSVSAASS